jgi:polysaccharide biosynthesis/export protein
MFKISFLAWLWFQNLPAQKLGANDLLSVSVYGAPEFSRTVRVGTDGQIVIPMLPHSIAAGGLLPRELEVKIADALRSGDLLLEPNVTVTVVEYQSRPISVTGAVRTPVTYQASGEEHLLDALTRAGGLAPEAGPEALILSGVTIRHVALKSLFEAADPSLNVSLQGNDEIRIPAAGRIFVLGNVKSSGSFPIQDTSDNTVIRALTLAGGFNGPPPRDAYIIRTDEASQTKSQIRIEMKDMIDRKIPDVALVAHDVLFVPNNRRYDTLQTIQKILTAGASGALAYNLAK